MFFSYIYILYFFAIFHFIVYVGTICVNANYIPIHHVMHVEYGNKALLLLSVPFRQLCKIAKRYLGQYIMTIMLTVVIVNDSIQSRGPTRSMTQDKVYPTWSVAVVAVVWSQPHRDGVDVLVVGSVVPHILNRAAPSARQFLGDNAETDTHAKGCQLPDGM